MHSHRPVLGIAFVAALAATGGWLGAQQSPFAGAEAVDVPGLKPVSGAPEQPFAAAQAVAIKDASTPSRPAWVDEPLDPSGHATVERVIPGHAGTPGTVDVVVLKGGSYQGMRDGVICLVERNNQFVGELVIVSTKADRSAGLITALGLNVTIQPGDVTRFRKLELPQS